MQSIIISNREEGLPPLLLPSLRDRAPSPTHSAANGPSPSRTATPGPDTADTAEQGAPAKRPLPMAENDGRHSPAGSSTSTHSASSRTSISSGLDSLASLASLATKRPRLAAGPMQGAAAGMGQGLPLPLPLPLQQPSAPGSALGRAAAVAVAVAAGAGMAGMASVASGASSPKKEPQEGVPAFPADATPPPDRKPAVGAGAAGGSPASRTSSASASRSATPVGSAGSSATGKGAPGSKRQRVGPSCDKCRLKKIKCDAHIEILAQDESVLAFASDRLHYALTKGDVERLQPQLEQQYGVERETLAAFLGQSFQGFNAGRGASNKHFIHSMSIIKHIDKLVLFKPCLSCCKRKHSAIITSFGGQQDPYAEFLNCCTFSKGFTRADINVFAKIAHKQQHPKPIYEMDTADYKDAGF